MTLNNCVIYDVIIIGAGASGLMSAIVASKRGRDVTGLLGGYNLQWAWSSGYVAGMSVN